MKKTTRFLAIVALSAGLLMAGCGKDDNGGDDDNISAEWVDLGLPSGLLWCTHNVGAVNSEDYGGYFAWGETTTKEGSYTLYNYRHLTPVVPFELYELTKYNTWSSYGMVDNLTILQPEDDAATVNMGGGARTPTKEDWEELMNNTTAYSATQNGVNGRIFTASNGNSIFLPAAGYNYRGVGDVGGSGRYWTSLLLEDDPIGAWYFNIDSYFQGFYRYAGLPVRAVRSAR